MKKLLLISIALCFVACKKEPISTDAKILRVTVAGATHQTFEYDKAGRLISEKEFYSCTVNPMNEYLYAYKDAKLEKLNSVNRGLYSSTAAFCDPSKGEKLERD